MPRSSLPAAWMKEKAAPGDVRYCGEFWAGSAPLAPLLLGAGPGDLRGPSLLLCSSRSTGAAAAVGCVRLHSLCPAALRKIQRRGNGSIPSLTLSHSPAGALSCSPCSKTGREKQIFSPRAGLSAGDPLASSGAPDGDSSSSLGWCGQRAPSLPSSHPSLPVAGGDTGWADSEVDSSCAGQPIHLWQFLKELLLKPHNYGRFIRWLNKDKGWRGCSRGPGAGAGGAEVGQEML